MCEYNVIVSVKKDEIFSNLIAVVENEMQELPPEPY